MTSKRVYALAGGALAILLVVGVLAYSMRASAGAQGSSGGQDSSETASNFRVLSQAHTDVCAFLGDRQANINYINSLSGDYYIQGACCNPMDYAHYVTQVNGLKNYSSITIIPPDPYNVSAPLAKQMISYDAIVLTSSQQVVLDSALKTSSEGPCCCQCWAWYAHEGLAKALISQHNWNAQQVADIWKLEDCCGGP